MNNSTTDQEEYLYRSWGSSTSFLWSYPIIDYVSLFRMKLIKEFLGDIGGKTVVDIGCGNGSISLLLWLLGAKVHSIDTSMEALQVTRSIRSLSERSTSLETLQATTGRRSLSERIPQFEPNLCQSDAMRLPYKGETFDIACCLETLEFVPDDMPAIKEIERVTKPGGMVLLFIPYDARATGEEKSFGYYRRYSFQTIKEKVGSRQLRLKHFAFWYFPMLKLLDLIRLRYIFAALGLLIEDLSDKNNSYKSRNLRNKDTFVHSLTRFYRTIFWRKAALPLLMHILDLNKLFQNSPYSNACTRANDVFLILRKTHYVEKSS
jgi:ubiquinone/menaquinone biosynthesis C-methylase UbiE